MAHVHTFANTPSGTLECPCGNSVRPFTKEELMTVPNEDRDALLAKWDDPERPIDWNSGDEHHLATLVIDALRRPPASGDNAEAREKAWQAWSESVEIDGGDASEQREGFNAAWSAASQPREVEVTEPTLIQYQARQSGKTEAMIERVLSRANERGIRVEVVYPQLEITEDMVAAAVERIKARLSWASLHWGTDGLHPDALPHIALAALGGGDHAE